MQKIQACIAQKAKMPKSELPSESEKQTTESEDEINIKKNNCDDETYIYDTFDNEENNCVGEFITEMFKYLTDREQTFVMMYYGINCEQEYTLEEIGRMYGLTKERVRQIIELGLKKIRSQAVILDYKYLSR